MWTLLLFHLFTYFKLVDFPGTSHLGATSKDHPESIFQSRSLSSPPMVGVTTLSTLLWERITSTANLLWDKSWILVDATTSEPTLHLSTPPHATSRNSWYFSPHPRRGMNFFISTYSYLRGGGGMPLGVVNCTQVHDVLQGIPADDCFKYSHIFLKYKQKYS